MRKQTFDRIKKTLAILLAVFFVVTTMAASVNACTSKAANANLPNKVVSNLPNNAVDANGLTEDQQTALGNKLLDMFDNGQNGYNNGWNSYNNGWNGYNNGWNGYNNDFDNSWGN
jgi:hypothetical protein